MFGACFAVRHNSQYRGHATRRLRSALASCAGASLVDEDNNLRAGWRMAERKDKLDPRRVLFTLRHEHNAIPPDFELLLYKDSRQWFAAVATSLFGERQLRANS